jgi:CHAD domain-containing protein
MAKTKKIQTKKIQRFLKEQLGEMEDHLDALCIKWDKERLHGLRVNSKRTRAVVSLLKYCSKSKKKLSIKKLKELFDHAGEIRTAQLNIEALHENKIQNEDFEKEQNVIFERESSELCKRKAAFKKNIEKFRKRISFVSPKIKNKKVEAYYHSHIKELSSNFSPSIKEEVLHDDRKIIKKLLLAFKALPKSLQNKININKDYLDDLQDKIGNWHDTVVTLEMLPDEDVGYQLLLDKKQEQLQALENVAKDFDKKVIILA